MAILSHISNSLEDLQKALRSSGIVDSTSSFYVDDVRLEDGKIVSCVDTNLIEQTGLLFRLITSESEETFDSRLERLYAELMERETGGKYSGSEGFDPQNYRPKIKNPSRVPVAVSLPLRTVRLHSFYLSHYEGESGTTIFPEHDTEEYDVSIDVRETPEDIATMVQKYLATKSIRYSVTKS